MKKVLFVILLLAGISVFCSCEKENNSVSDKDTLENTRWLLYKQEDCFNGEAVNTLTESFDINVIELSFSKENVIAVGENNVRATYSYSLVDGILNILFHSFEVRKHTSKELILDLVYESEALMYPDESIIKNQKVIDEFRGVKIYSNDGYLPYWYYDKKNTIKVCDKYWNSKDYSDYWYDTERYYFKAE